MADLSDSKTATVISSSLTPEDIAKILQERQVTVVRDTAQVSMEIGVIRPGETAFVYDLLSLDGFSNSPQKITGSDDVNHVLKLLSDIQSLLDHAVVNAFVFAENHTKLKNRISVLRFISEKDLEEGLRRFVEAQWLGEFPKSGLYFADPIYRLLRRKVWHTGSTKDRRVFREDVGLIRFSKVAEIKTEDGLIVKELPEYSEEQYFALEVPNYDYLELPSKVNNSEALKEWLGLAKKPLLKR